MAALEIDSTKKLKTWDLKRWLKTTIITVLLTILPFTTFAMYMTFLLPLQSPQTDPFQSSNWWCSGEIYASIVIIEIINRRECDTNPKWRLWNREQELRSCRNTQCCTRTEAPGCCCWSLCSYHHLPHPCQLWGRQNQCRPLGPAVKEQIQWSQWRRSDTFICFKMKQEFTLSCPVESCGFSGWGWSRPQAVGTDLSAVFLR